MQLLLVVLTLGASLALVAPAAGQSLAEVSRATEEARKAAAGKPPAKVYTNKDLPPADPKPPAPAPDAQSATPAPAATARPADTPSTPPAGALSQGAKDETYWRDRMRPLRERLDSARALADATKRQADALMRSADRCFQIGIVCADYTESVRLLDQHKALVADVASAERDVFALQEEARRAGVPPGWLRP
jgi:hypothetical protein